MLRKIIYTLLLLSTFAKAQHAPTAMVNTAMNSFISQCGTRLSAIELYAINNFVAVNIANGNWAVMDRAWIFAQSIQANSRISIKNPTSTAVTETNSPTWTQYQGYTGNGTTSYIVTNYSLVTGGNNFVLNSADFGVYVNSIGTAARNSVELGACTSGGAVSTSLYTRYSDDNMYALVNHNAGAFATGSISTALGLTSGRRTASNAVAIWKDGVSQYTNTTASSSVPAYDLYVLARNVAGNSLLVDNFSDRRVAFAYAGSSAIGTLNLYNSLNLIAHQLGFHF